MQKATNVNKYLQWKDIEYGGWFFSTTGLNYCKAYAYLPNGSLGQTVRTSGDGASTYRCELYSTSYTVDSGWTKLNNSTQEWRENF